MANDRIKHTAKRVSTLRNHFINHERFEPLEAQFTLLLEKRLADIEAGQINEAHGMALSGPSGAGKTTAMTFLAQQTQERLRAEGHGDRCIVSLRAPSPATQKSVGQALLRELGYKISSERQAWYIWDLVRHQLKELGVAFILLDEAQELASRGTKHELASVASMLKTLMTDPEWPVGIILSGTLELEGILNHDPQLARRMKTVRFNSLSPIADAQNAVDLIGAYCDAGEVSAHESIQKQAMGKRLIHAAANQFGLVIELTIAALEQAFLEASSTLRREHFAKAYHCRSACDDTLNPFIIPDFYRVDPRQVFPEADT
ncbi:AAA domain-containing protein [Epibacterium ulvae]|uniref:AAA domain-containing protein n=1 Tax=Epibacterium ulvae TaxID=1156985 RepID=A0A1G5RHF7_9RHOB|nr:ATP-binding protein [Epibacterium ulvae]SCZ72801.1 AAA domain-containing protein [Epibacterium ulvae]